MEIASISGAGAVVEQRRGEFLISTERARLDLDVIHGFLTNCYWAKRIPRDVVARSIEHSLCFGIYDESDGKAPRLAKNARHGAPGICDEETPGLSNDTRPFDGAQGRHGACAQVGFARVVSDFATVAYLGDVFVLEPYRGRGLSKWLMECILRHPALHALRRWILLTRDAHELYAQFGFTVLKSPERYMELHQPDVYETSKD